MLNQRVELFFCQTLAKELGKIEKMTCAQVVSYDFIQPTVYRRQKAVLVEL